MNDLNDIFVTRVNLSTPRDIIDEAAKVNLKGKGKHRAGECYIKIKSNEGANKPHFHIDSVASDFHCCVMIYEPLYFHHLSGESDLTNEQCVILDMVLRDKLWYQLDATWRQAFGGPLFEKYCKDAGLDIKNLKQPDYTTLNF